MISQDRLQKALAFIAETDEKLAQLKTDMERAAYKVKLVKSAVFVHEEGAMDLRKAVAEGHTHTESAVEEWLEALKEFEALQNKRKTEALIVDVWRSLNSARTKGMIV